MSTEDNTTGHNEDNILGDLTFAPDWARSSADEHYTNLNKYPKRFEQRDDDGEESYRGKREGRREKRPPREGRRFHRDEFDGDRGGSFREGRRNDRDNRSSGESTPVIAQERPSGGAQRRSSERRDGEQRRSFTPPPYSVRFLPSQEALTLCARKITASKRAMSLKDVVSIFYQNPDSVMVRVEFDEEHKDSRFYQCSKCQWFSDDAGKLRQHLVSEHFGDAFEAVEITVDPPNGKFTAVARCGVTGKLLAPPNYHTYQRRIEEMLDGPCANMSEAEYRSKIELVSDPEVIEQWRQDSTKQVVYKRKGDTSEDAKTYSHDEALQIFFSEIATGLVRQSRAVTVSHAISKTLNDARMIREISHAWDVEQRSRISQFHFAVRGGLKARKLFAFHLPDTCHNEYLIWKAPTVLNPDTAIQELKDVLECIAANPESNRASVMATLAPEGTPPEKVAAYRKQLEFLIGQVNVIEFVNGRLMIPQA